MDKKKKLSIEALLSEYELLITRYKDFSFTIRSILENVLKINNFKYQSVTCREKTELSLKEKLKNFKKIKTVKEIDDLSGARIIFYLDRDIHRIIQYLEKEFIIEKRNLKYSDDDYNAFHIIVKLNKDRLKLTEYQQFKSLRCEIQLTTVLNHAWSELAHDVIYKPPKSLSEFDKKEFESIKNRFSEVMKNHIKQAQYSFDFIFNQIEKINQGQQIFDIGFLKSILDSNTNNEIYEYLKNLLKYIEEFGDKTPKDLNIIEIISRTLGKSSSLKKEPIITSLGEYPGHDYIDIHLLCLDILDRLKFTYFADVFKIICQLSIDENEKIKLKALDVASNMSKFIYWPKQKKIYFQPQIFILSEIEKWSDVDLTKYLNLILTVSKNMLTPHFEGTSWSDINTVIFHQGALPGNEIVNNIRSKSINILKRIFNLIKQLPDKQKIMELFDKATVPPHQNGYTPELENIIRENVSTLIAYYLLIIRNESFEIIKKIEKQINLFSKHFNEGFDDLNKLQLIIQNNKEYQIYKVLVGWDYHRIEELNWNEAAEERKIKVNEYIHKINNRVYAQWEERILKIASTYNQSVNHGGFEYFNLLLSEWGKIKPEIAYKFLVNNEDVISPFVVHLLVGIWQSTHKEIAKKIMLSWIDEYKHLSACSILFFLVKEVDENLLTRIFLKAKEKNDHNALTNIIRSILQNFDKLKGGKDLFIDCITELGKNNVYYWVNYVAYSGSSVLEILIKDEWQIIFDSLCAAPNIDDNIETIISLAIPNYLEEVLSFFYKRIKYEIINKDQSRYEAIPFSFDLSGVLINNAGLVIELILQWYDEEDWLMYWEASKLLQLIFPKFHEELENQLIQLLKSNVKNKDKIIIFILRAYKGEKFLHKVCKVFIKKHPNSKKIYREMFVILSQMGVVSGEYGTVESYKHKKNEIQDWKNERSKILVNFAKQYENYLIKNIDYEKKRADETIEIRKLDFDSREDQ